jgi:DNA-binding CsgD family transcriptional regulator
MTSKEDNNAARAFRWGSSMDREQLARIRTARDRHRRCEISAGVEARRIEQGRPVPASPQAESKSGEHRIWSASQAHTLAEREFNALPVPSQEGLKTLFDLTAAECRLAQHLARGDSIEEIAQKLSIKMATARTQLAAIFSKTGARRQAKLVAILSRIAHIENEAKQLPSVQQDYPAKVHDGVRSLLI